MYFDVYIAFLDGTKDQNGHPKLGENPTVPTIRRSPFFPSGSKAFWELKRRIEEGVYEGWQVDWGAWGAVVTKQQIIDFINDVHAKDNLVRNPLFPYLRENLNELIAFAEALDPETEYALVASEL